MSEIKVAREKPTKKRTDRDPIITGRIARRISNVSNHSIRIHIQPNDGKWSVRREGASRAFGIFSDKRKALTVAKEKKDLYVGSYIIIHDIYGGVKQIIN